MKKTLNEKALKEAYKIIADNLGSSAVKLYQNFYKGKDKKTITLSLQEILTELVGPENAKKQLKKF